MERDAISTQTNNEDVEGVEDVKGVEDDFVTLFFYIKYIMLSTNSLHIYSHIFVATYYILQPL